MARVGGDVLIKGQRFGINGGNQLVADNSNCHIHEDELLAWRLEGPAEAHRIADGLEVSPVLGVDSGVKVM